MATILREGDDRYEEIRTAYIAEGSPGKLLYHSEGWLSFHDADGLFFVSVDRSDDKYLDRMDPTGRWNNVYGYHSDEVNPDA